VWPALPGPLRSAAHEKRANLPDVDSFTLDNIPLTFFLRKVLVEYVAEVTAPPPVWSRTRASECEICEREVPLTYHHLIPREVHAKALKKKWHLEGMLNSVAWLCRVLYLDRLLEREDVQKWRKYISKQRWGVKRG
ncbi:uncharacterized protein B0H18DRAFT_1009268, partial [Fomitopsis serialis]|uniref:uncharacterized protein n=1 Tax=Fomitopsis serialis TaxID=139415 RepID=UPI002008AEF8